MKFKFENKQYDSTEITKAIWTLFDGKDRGVSDKVISFVKPYYEAVEKHPEINQDGNYFVSHIFYELNKIKSPLKKKVYQVTFKKTGEIVFYDKKTIIALDKSEEELGTKGSWINRTSLPYENEKIRLEEFHVYTAKDIKMKHLFLRLVDEGFNDVRISSKVEIFVDGVHIRYAQGFCMMGKKFKELDQVIDYLKKTTRKVEKM